MSGEPDDAERDEEILEAEQPEDGASEPEEHVEPDEQEDEGFVIEIEGDDEEDARDSAPIRQLREQIKEEKRRRIEAEARSAPKLVELGPKPTLESCDYDESRFEEQLTAWHDRKNAGDREAADQAKAKAAQEQETARVHARYKENAARLQAQAKLTPEAYQASEDAVCAAIPELVQGLMIRYLPEHAPLLTHALGSRPASLAKIAEITDPIAQLLALHKLVIDPKGVKMKPKAKSPPPPEERVSGSGPISRQSDDKRLEQLEKEAEKTGDRTKIIAFKKQIKERGK